MKLSNSKVTILAHSVEQTTGFPDAFVDYLNRRKTEIVHIRFPFFFSVSKAIWVDHFVNGELKSRRKSWIRFYQPQLVSFLKDFLWTLTVGVWHVRGSEFVLVTNNLLGLAAWIFRSLGLIGKFTYLVVDYSPRRFANPLVEALYVWLDRFIAYRADSVWTMSMAMLEGRARDGKVKLGKINARLSPVGNNSHLLTAQELAAYAKDDLVYVGNPNAKNVRADLLVEVLAELKRRGRRFRLIFVGPGDVGNLRVLSENLGVESQVVFHGPILEALDLDRFLAKCSIGLAPYDPTLPDNFSRFADPAKIKTYLGAGLPVITTSVPPNAGELETNGAGKVAEFSKEAHADMIESILADDGKYRRMREASYKMGQSYSWPSIFDRLLKEENFL